MFAPVAESGKGGAADHEERQYGEPRWTETQVDHSTHGETTQRSVPTYHLQSVGEPGEEARYHEGAEHTT
jgi:hypothetical protein